MPACHFSGRFLPFYPRSSAVMPFFWLASAIWICSIASFFWGQSSVAPRGTIFVRTSDQRIANILFWDQIKQEHKSKNLRPGSETTASFSVVGHSPSLSGPWRRASTPDCPWSPWHHGSLMAACWARVELPPESVHWWGSDNKQFMKLIVKGGSFKTKICPKQMTRYCLTQRS